MRRSGKGSSVANVSRWKAVSGPISTNVVSRAVDARPAARDRPRGVGVQAVRGLREPQPGGLGGVQEAVEEAARERDVVVDDEQPVEAVGRVGGEQRVEVLELAARAGRRGVDLDLVPAAQQLGPRRVHDHRGPLDPEHEHAAAGRARRARHGRAARAAR